MCSAMGWGAVVLFGVAQPSGLAVRPLDPASTTLDVEARPVADFVAVCGLLHRVGTLLQRQEALGAGGWTPGGLKFDPMAECNSRFSRACLRQPSGGMAASMQQLGRNFDPNVVAGLVLSSCLLAVSCLSRSQLAELTRSTAPIFGPLRKGLIKKCP